MTHRLPCGNCQAGLYDIVPVLEGLTMFGECASREEAISKAPVCKCDPSLKCQGALDWIASASLPMTEEQRGQMVWEASA